MSQICAVVLLNGLPYRVLGLSHNTEGSRIRYTSVEALEKAVQAKLEKSQRVHGQTPVWTGTLDGDAIRVEGRPG